MIGQVLNGTYQLTDLIGSGGYANVYRASDLRTGTVVAVKVLHSHFARMPDIAARFEREVSLARRLQTPYVARILDAGQDAASPPYMVMEYVEGLTVAQVIQQRGARPFEEAANIVDQLLNALKLAHAFGIVHRDIKPHNLMIDGNGRLKVLDFGVARIVGAGTITATGELLGTPEYMAPEQLNGGPIDARADIYAAGAVFYHLLAGRPPYIRYSEGDIWELVRRVRSELPPPIQQLRPDVPAGLASIVERAMARDPGQRYQTAFQMQEALAEAAGADPPTPQALTIVELDRSGEPPEPPPPTRLIPTLPSEQPTVEQRTVEQPVDPDLTRRNMVRPSGTRVPPGAGQPPEPGASSGAVPPGADPGHSAPTRLYETIGGPVPPGPAVPPLASPPAPGLAAGPARPSAPPVPPPGYGPPEQAPPGYTQPGYGPPPLPSWAGGPTAPTGGGPSSMRAWYIAGIGGVAVLLVVIGVALGRYLPGMGESATPTATASRVAEATATAVPSTAVPVAVSPTSQPGAGGSPIVVAPSPSAVLSPTAQSVAQATLPAPPPPTPPPPLPTLAATPRISPPQPTRVVPSTLPPVPPKPGSAPKPATPPGAPNAAPPAGRPGVLLADTFDRADGGQLPSTSPRPDDYLFAYERGEYVVRKVNPTLAAAPIVFVKREFENTVIAVDVRLVGDVGARYAFVVCRDSSAGGQTRQYRVSIVPEQRRVILSRWDAGNQSVLAETRDNPAVQAGSGTNRLELRCAGTKIEAIVNGKSVAAAEDGTLTSGEHGLGAGTFAGVEGTLEARFDNLEVRSP
ncbi:MAG: protein kinase [Chloroflexota bacterium]